MGIPFVETTSCVITGQLDTLTAFAIRQDDGAQVFVPASLSKNHELTIGDTVELLLTAQPENERTPWRALRLVDGKPPSAVQPEQELRLDGAEPSAEEEVLRFVAIRGVVTVRKVADFIYGEESDPSQAQYLLSKLHGEGKVARASVCAVEGQARASLVLYALSTDMFVALV